MVLSIMAILFSLLPLDSIGSEEKKDSLFNALEKADRDSLRCTILTELGWSFLYSDPDSSEYFGRKAYERAVSIKDTTLMARAMNVIGISSDLRGDYEKALNYYRKAMKFFKAKDDLQGISTTTENIGIIYWRRGNYPKAVEHYLTGLKMKEEQGDEVGMAKSHGNLGIVMDEMGEQERALSHYQKALELLKGKDEDNLLSACLSNIGLIHKKRDNMDRAEFYLLRALRIDKENGAEQRMAIDLTNLGEISYSKGNLDTALLYHEKAMAIEKELGDLEGLANSHIGSGRAYLKKGLLEKAILHCNKGLDIAKKTQLRKLRKEACSCLGSAYERTGDNQKAVHFLKSYIALKDSLMNEQKAKEITRKRMKYEFEKKQLADSLARAKKRKLRDIQHQQEVQFQKNLFYGAGGLALSILIIALLLWRGIRQKQKHNKVISEKSKEVEEQKELVDAKNKEITDSISYAERIQKGILPEKRVKEAFPNSFILFKPKDIVSGDFYWFEEKEDERFLAVVDCTGHGVPGAMVSIVGHKELQQTFDTTRFDHPAELMDTLSSRVEMSFSNNILGEEYGAEVQDGMDMSMIAVDHKNKIIRFAGANQSLYIIKDDSLPDADRVIEGEQGKVLNIFKGDDQPVGKHFKKGPFTHRTISFKTGDRCFMFSDGYPDQFGGPNGKKFKPSRFRQLLLDIQTYNIHEQKEALQKEFLHWQGDHEQIDDVLVIGVEL